MLKSKLPKIPQIRRLSAVLSAETKGRSEFGKNCWKDLTGSKNIGGLLGKNDGTAYVYDALVTANYLQPQAVIAVLFPEIGI